LPSNWSALRVRVPGSTSNLGPGFDQLGVALDLFLEACFQRAPDGAGLRVDAPPGWPAPAQDRLLECLTAALGAPPTGSLTIASEIPIGRGIGSSGAATVAGLLLGRALAGDLYPDRKRLLALAIEFEGHPDNVGAALFGGAVASCPHPEGGVTVLPLPLAERLEFALAWPDQPLFTPAARGVLPRSLSREDAVFNARRLTLLLAGLASGRGDLLAEGLEDRWHVPYRLPLLPGSKAAFGAARAAGAFGATLSGAGSALLALCPPGRGAAVAEAMAGELRRATGAGHGRLARVVHGVPVVGLETAG
jgi:homoserine kinase